MTSFHEVARVGYEIARDDEAWVDGIARTASELFGRPAISYLLRSDAAPGRRFAAVSRATAASARTLHSARYAHAALPAPVIRRLYAQGPFARLWSEQMASLRAFAEVPESSRDHERADVFGIYGGSAEGGCMVCVPQVDPVAPRTRWAARRLAAHLHAAYRLREAATGEPDAVLDEDGNVLEVLGGEADALAGATSATVDAARASRSSDDDALAAWQGLVAGRWSLVQATSRQGRRTLVLRRNELADVSQEEECWRRPAQVAALAARGHSNKYIAYELGVPVSTVAADVKRMLGRLGLEHRVELAGLSASLVDLTAAA